MDWKLVVTFGTIFLVGDKTQLARIFMAANNP